MDEPYATLEEYLETRKPGGNGFKAVPHYFPDGDFISCFASDERCYAKQVGERLTVYYSDKTGEVVGCKIKGVKAIMGRAEPARHGVGWGQ